MQDPVQLQDRGGRQPGPHQCAVELVEVPWPELGQAHSAELGNRVASDELLISGPGAGSKRRLDGFKPGGEELLDGGALVPEDLAVPLCLQGGGELAGYLGPGLAVQELASSLAAVPAKVERRGPAAVWAPIDGALAAASSSAAHAAASRRSCSTYSATAAAGMRRQAPIRTDWMMPARSSSAVSSAVSNSFSMPTSLLRRSRTGGRPAGCRHWADPHGGDRR